MSEINRYHVQLESFDIDKKTCRPVSGVVDYGTVSRVLPLRGYIDDILIPLNRGVVLTTGNTFCEGGRISRLTGFSYDFSQDASRAVISPWKGVKKAVTDDDSRLKVYDLEIGHYVNEHGEESVPEFEVLGNVRAAGGLELRDSLIVPSGRGFVELRVVDGSDDFVTVKLKNLSTGLWRRMIPASAGGKK